MIITPYPNQELTQKMCKSKKNLTNSVTNPIPRTSITQLSSTSYSSSSTTYEPSSSSSSSSWKFSSSSLASSKNNRISLSNDDLRKSILPEQPHIYRLSEIRSATNNFLLKPFSSSSSSTSWRCMIRTQKVLVVQRKIRHKIDTSELIERLSYTCKGHHASLVKLKGASISGSSVYLVYEFVEGVNLVNCLRNVKNPSYTVLSTWLSRVRVASDVAYGVDYMHNSNGLGYGFVHNRIKSSSIIVTEPCFGAKICHFGTAEICGEIGESDGKVEGTRGYMSPEFQVTGIATEKSDVYAFGVVVLELLSGEEALKYTFDEGKGGYGRRSVVETAREAVVGGGGGVRKWVDKRLKDSFPVEVAEKMVRMALECVAEDPDNRPGMGKVVGRVSSLFLESQKWEEKMGSSLDLTVSFAPR